MSHRDRKREQVLHDHTAGTSASITRSHTAHQSQQPLCSSSAQNRCQAGPSTPWNGTHSRPHMADGLKCQSCAMCTACLRMHVDCHRARRPLLPSHPPNAGELSFAHIHTPTWHGASTVTIPAYCVMVRCVVQVRHEKDEPVDDLLALVKQIVPYHMTHNAGMLYVRATGLSSQWAGLGHVLCLPGCVQCRWLHNNVAAVQWLCRHRSNHINSSSRYWLRAAVLSAPACHSPRCMKGTSCVCCQCYAEVAINCDQLNAAPAVY